MNAKNLLVTLFALVTTISNAQINPFVYYTFEGVATGQQWNSWTGTTPECTASCIPCPITPPGTLPNTSLIGEVGHYALLTTSNGQLRNNSVILNNINGYSFETLIRFDQGTGIQRRATLFSLTTSAGTYLNFYFDFDLTGGGSSIEFITDLDGNNGQQADNFSIELNGIDRKSMQYYMDNDWHHIAFSYNPITGEKKVWVDGVCPVEFTSFAINIGAITSSPPCTLFVNAAASNDRIVGGIDEIAYYDNVISNEEIAQHYLDFSGIHSHYTYQLTEPPSYNISLSSDVDPNEFPFGHAIGGGELSSANVSHSAIEQLHSYSLPRFKPGNLLHKNMNLVRSKLIGDNSSTILATKLQTSLDVQIELASNWNYYFNLAENISVEWNEINQSNTHPNKWMSWVDQNYIGLAQNFQYAAFTNRRQIRPSDYYPVGSSPYPTNFRNSLLRYNGFDGAPFNYPKQDVYFVNNNNFSFCNLNGTEIADQNNGVKFWVPSSIIANYVDDGNTTKLYLNPVLNRLNSIGKKLSFIAENNEASPTYNIDDDTDVDFIPEVFEDKPMEVACSTSVGHVCSTLEWKQYIGDRKIFVDNDSYRNVIINGDPLLNECNFLNYAVDGGPVDRYYWPKLRETQLFNTSGTNGIFKNAYSTMDFYPITPSRWKVQNVNLTVNDIGQVPRGWRWVARSRNVEISAGDKLMAPYVGAGWYPDEERNFRPGQWLGLMKCLGLTGVDFYHAYYDYGSGEPKGYIWQVAPPSYAQAILSRIDHIIVYGNVLPGDVYATPGTPSQGRAFAFNTGNPLHLVVVRQDSDLVAAAPIAKYAISGSIQKIINMIGDAPLEQNVKIDLKAGVGTPDFLQFNIRRQGNTYVLDRTRANSNDYAFYQLDKWHQWEHPERWSKDFDFEAEAFDNPTQTLENSIHTENASHSAITDGDYRNYTSYVSSSVNIYDYNFQPRVNAPFYLFIRARRNGGTATVSSININLYNTTTSSGFALKTIGCIDNGEWLWYMIDNVSGTGINYNLIANNNYRLSIQDLNNNVLIDRIYLGLTNAAPDNGIAVSSSLCPGPIQFNASVTPITCYGSLSGSITINANGGSGWYDFNVDGGSWITGVNASYTSPNLSAGTHTLQVRDQNNTTSVSQIFLATISQPLFPLACTMQVVNNCNNATLAGKITAAVTGGNMNGYSYLWSNGSLNGSIENLANGNYTVTVTDAKGCTVSSSATISTKILQASVATSNIITTDCGSGSITITLTGGSGTTPYLYSSDGGINYVNNSINPSYTFNNRVPGVYVGQLKDVDGCLAIMTGNPVTIGPGTDGFTTTITANPTNLICNGLTADLSITATGSGYRYLWSSGQTTSNINNVPAGTYSVSVTQTSAPSCTARNIITVTEPTAIELENSTTNKSCSTGANNGSATIQINGGTIPYNIVWSTGAINQNTITNLAAGNYSVSVTDYNGCHSVKYFTITVPNTNPNPSLVQTLPVTCGGGNDGEIKAIATGGIGPYTFLWNTGQTSNVLSNVSASTYTVTITDVFGCTGQSFITLTGGGVNTTVTPTNTICFGNTGSITFSTTSGGGGSGTYQYSIDDGMNFQISNIFSGLSVGTYIAVAQEISSLCTSLKQSLTISTTGTSCCIGGVAELTQSSFNGGAYSGINNLNSSVTIPSGATVTLDACTLFVAANVSITVSAGATLIINNNSVLSACGNMWQGIINNGGSVFIENSIIEDAIEGLRSFNGSLFDISGSTFDHNGTSIYLDYGDFTSSRITNTEFKCTDGRITKAPYANQLSLYHIRMDWVTYFKLGNTLNATNALRNSTYGIYANQSSFDMENNVFDFDKTVPFNVYGNIPRTAVRCSNSLFDNIHIGTSAYPSNTVRNWQYGIIAGGGSTVDIQNNIITDGSLGVAVGGNLNTDITVLSNVFERCSRGTFLDGVDGSQALVQNNFYNKGLSYDFANYSYEAIRCENKLPTQVPAINIEGNEIYNCSIGIHVRNIEGTKINSQNIYQTDMPNDDIAIYGRPQFGIWIENASYTEINNNTITRNDFSSDPLHISGAPQVDLITGI